MLGQCQTMCMLSILYAVIAHCFVKVYDQTLYRKNRAKRTLIHDNAMHLLKLGMTSLLDVL